jgi:hypothetical protein
MDLQIRVDHLEIAEAEVRMPAVAKGPPGTFGRVVGGLPRRVVREHAQVGEVVSIQVLLLLAERRELSSGGVLVPGAVPLLGFRGRTLLASPILPDGKSRFQEAAGDTEPVSDRAHQQLGQGRLLIIDQMLRTMEGQGAVQPQVHISRAQV